MPDRRRVITTLIPFAILVATRNRPAQLDKLLNSISGQSHLPNQIVIVSSGDGVESIINKFGGLKIEYIHSDISGQIHQKQIGIKRISHDIDWVIFLDDDLELLPDCIDKLINRLAKISISDSILGIGLNCLQEEPDIRTSFSFWKKAKAGKVLNSGRNISYMDSPEEIFTEWLNGASAWRRSVLSSYNFPSSNLKYAFAEDVIFSYAVGKKGKLLYLPSAKVKFQVTTTFQSRSIDVWKAQAQWGLYFISSYNEFSRFKFYCRLIGTSVKFVTKNKMDAWPHIPLITRELFRILKCLLFTTNAENIMSTLST